MPPAPDLVEQMYCSQQIQIPPSFPYILKQYAKAAIRTQPYDLLRWSVAYFRAMASAEEPPVKARLEYPPIELPSGLTPGYLKVLLKQFGDSVIISTELLYNRWQGMCLNENALCEMLKLGGFGEEVNFLQFVAIAAGHLTNTLSQTMIMICELLTNEPEGGSSMIPCDVFCDLYKYLANMDCGPPSLEQPQDKQVTIDNNEEKIEAEFVASEVVNEVIDAVEEGIEGNIGTEAVNEVVDDVEEGIEGNIGTEAVNEVVDDVEEGIEGNIRKKIVKLIDTIGKETEGQEENAEANYVQEDDVGIIPPESAAEEKRKTVWRSEVEVPGIGSVISNEQIDSVLGYMKYWAERQEGMVMPRNVRHFLCPPLDLLPLPEP